MKFICEKCKTKYNIADEKIRGKILKIRCRTCSNIIEIREPGEPIPSAPKAVAKPSTHGALKAAKRPGGTGLHKRASAIGQPRSGARAPIQAKSPSKSSPSLGVKPSPLERPRHPQSAAVARKPTPAPRPTEQAKAEWYLGDDRGEYGPMTFSELAARVQRGEPGPNAEGWREGFGDWQPLKDIPELTPYLKHSPPPRPVGGQRPSAPASPYQKQPGQDAMASPEAADERDTHRPRAAKVSPVGRELAEPLTKSPMPQMNAAAPTPAAELKAAPAVEDSWTGVPESANLAAYSLPREEPQSAQSSLATPGPAPLTAAAHVSMTSSGSDLEALRAMEKRARKPTLLIGALVGGLCLVVLTLAIYLISSRKKPSSSEGEKPKTAALTDPMKAAVPAPLPAPDPMPSPMTPPPMTADPNGGDLSLPALDIEADTGMKSSRRRRKKNGTGMTADAMVAPSRPAAPDLGAIPTMRHSFVGFMGLGSTNMTSTTPPVGLGGGGKPKNLGSMVKRNYNYLKRCYEKAARLNSRLKNPKLRITIKVGTNGRAKFIHISPSRHQSNSLGICVRRSMMQWRWPTWSADYSYSFFARFHGS